jgi:hypothetical protein
MEFTGKFVAVTDAQSLPEDREAKPSAMVVDARMQFKTIRILSEIVG